MRLKKGSKVEVLKTWEIPSGFWCPAEIISGNGHTYSVKYNYYTEEMGSMVERVPRKDIRPCPPMVGTRNWVTGDIVEALENNSWKPAQVLKVVDGGNYFFVRLLGSSRELRAHKSYLRLRQSWKYSSWAVIEKESGEGYDGKIDIVSKVEKIKCGKLQPCLDVRICRGDGQFLNRTDHCCEDPCRVSSRDMGKKNQLSRKMETSMKDGKRQRLVASHSFQLPEKVDAVASQQIMFGGKYTHNTLKNSTSQISAVRLEPSDSESHSSSVGSSSPSYSPYRSKFDLNTRPTQDLSIHFGDEEAPFMSSREPYLPRKDGLRSEIHQLELNGYRATLVAFYASGPLSWEQEALLTNLRLMLHITNDEHLLELKHLSTTNCYSD